MTDEEKIAIERLNKRYEFFKENPLATNVWLTLDIHDLGIVLNIIEKQQKEIENLKEQNKNLNWYFENQKDNFVHKDKIKAKIEEYDDKGMIVNLVNRSVGKTFQQAVHYEVKKVLQSLLEKE